MTTKNQVHDMKALPALALTTVSDGGGAVQTAIIDTQGYEALTLLLDVQAGTDGDFVVTAEEGDDAALADAAAVGADFLQGKLAFDFAASVVNRVAYNGHKRYVRFTITPTGATTGIDVTGVAVLGLPHEAPVANP